MGCMVVGALAGLVLFARGYRFVAVVTVLLAIGLYFVTTPQRCWWSPGNVALGC